MKFAFRWNDWNLAHIAGHGVALAEAERVVRNAPRGFPRMIGNGKWLVEGRGQGDRMVRVIYLLSPPGTIFVIHAMPLTTRRRR